MHMTDRGLMALVRHEGLVPGPYLDVKQVWTFGIGHTTAAGPPHPATMPRGMPADLDAGIREAFRVFRADLARYEIAPDGWDGIVSIFCHLRADIRARVHRQVVRGLKRGGVYVYEAYTPKQLEYNTGGPPDRELLVTLADAERELAGLEFVVAQETVREVVEGSLHVGYGAVVQVVAVRPGSATEP